MKKIIILLAVILISGCGLTRQIYTPAFEHSVAKQIKVENPSFAVYIVPGYYISETVWLANEIETVLLDNGVKVYALVNKNQIATKTTGEIKHASSKDESATAAKDFINVETTTDLNQLETKATFIIKASYDNCVFKIISVATQEVVASGTFTRRNSENIRDNMTVILKEMNVITGR